MDAHRANPRLEAGVQGAGVARLGSSSLKYEAVGRNHRTGVGLEAREVGAAGGRAVTKAASRPENEARLAGCSPGRQ